MIRAGEARDLADAARTIGVTRARMTQIMNLLLLAPEIQEAILGLPLVTNGRDHDDPWPAAGIGAFFATLLGLCRALAGEDFAPMRVNLKRSDFGAGEVYRRSFRAPVTFSAPQNVVRFRRDDVEASISKSDPTLELEVDGIAERYLRSLTSTPTVTRIRAVLVDMLPSGGATQGKIARRLHTSVSSLQRQLRKEGTSYRAVVDDTRRELAVRYLEVGRYTLSEVAFLLGFADQAGMSRAFKRWTGVPPGSYAT